MIADPKAWLLLYKWLIQNLKLSRYVSPLRLNFTMWRKFTANWTTRNYFPDEFAIYQQYYILLSKSLIGTYLMWIRHLIVKKLLSEISNTPTTISKSKTLANFINWMILKVPPIQSKDNQSCLIKRRSKNMNITFFFTTTC